MCRENIRLFSSPYRAVCATYSVTNINLRYQDTWHHHYQVLNFSFERGSCPCFSVGRPVACCLACSPFSELWVFHIACLSCLCATFLSVGPICAPCTSICHSLDGQGFPVRVYATRLWSWVFCATYCLCLSQHNKHKNGQGAQTHATPRKERPMKNHQTEHSIHPRHHAQPAANHSTRNKSGI